jgi:Zn-finger domain-containing protein
MSWVQNSARGPVTSNEDQPPEKFSGYFYHFANKTQNISGRVRSAAHSTKFTLYSMTKRSNINNLQRNEKMILIKLTHNAPREKYNLLE